MITSNKGPLCERCHGPMIFYLNPARYICPSKRCPNRTPLLAPWRERAS